MIFNHLSKWSFKEFVNARFHLFIIQTKGIHVFTRVRNVFWNIVSFAFRLIFGCLNHGMLILRPLAAQLSYLLIYWSSALLGLGGQAGRVLKTTVTGLWPLHPGEHFPHSSALFLDSNVHFPGSSLDSLASRPKASKVWSQGVPQARL